MDALVQKNPSPKLWHSVPGLIEEIIEKGFIEYEAWSGYVSKLAQIFLDFDYERESADDVYWVNRAINHPLGTLVLLHLNKVQKEVQQQQRNGSSYTINKHSKRFFTTTLQKYNIGSRYALCLLSEHLGWFEAVDKEWSDQTMRPYFLWDRDDAASIVAWSGYAMSRNVAKSLVDEFDETYMGVVSRLPELSESVQKGIRSHFAGIFWYGGIDHEQIYEVLKSIDNNGLQNIIGYWESHLKQSGADNRVDFFKEKMIPLWGWLRGQGRLDGDTGDENRWALIQLIPYSGSAFHEVYKLAVETAPRKIDSINLFLKNLINSELFEVDDSGFIELLIVILKADMHPNWHKEDWKLLLELVTVSKSPQLTSLKDEAARKEIE